MTLLSYRTRELRALARTYEIVSSFTGWVMKNTNILSFNTYIEIL